MMDAHTYFTGLAMQELLRDDLARPVEKQMKKGWIAEQAKEMADAILAGNESMTLRDHFAAKAMQGLLSAPDVGVRYKDAAGTPEWIEKQVAFDVASTSYLYADAMLAAREAGYALDDGCEPVEVEAALASRDAEIERLRHALELAVPVMDAHAGPSRLAEFVSAGRTAQAAREAFDEAAEMRRAEWHAEMRADAFGHPHE